MNGDEYVKLRGLFASILLAGFNANNINTIVGSDGMADTWYLKAAFSQADAILEECGIIHPGLTIPG